VCERTVYVSERTMYVYERRMYVCERARINYVLYGPSYYWVEEGVCTTRMRLLFTLSEVIQIIPGVCWTPPGLSLVLNSVQNFYGQKI